MKFYLAALPLGLLSPTPISAACPPFTVPPKDASGFNSNKLPNPFKLQSGAAVTTKADWACKRAELKALMLAYEFGDLPPKPSLVRGSLTPDNKLTVSISENGKSISFNATINLPVNPASSGPYPAVIAFGGSSIPIDNTTLATIIFPNDEIAKNVNIQHEPRGLGKFYDIYGKNHSAGTLIAWTWGLSRLIDALESLGPSITNIDPTRLAVTGCSRNGKGAMVAGAFDDRIALTIPQEGGEGTANPWRMYNPTCMNRCVGDWAVWRASSWFRAEFPQPGFPQLPYDKHELVALVAPRGLYVPDKVIDWMYPVDQAVGAAVGRYVFRALGVEGNMGFDQWLGAHCAFPGGSAETLDRFYRKFLLGERELDTGVWRTNVEYHEIRYIDWTPPRGVLG